MTTIDTGYSLLTMRARVIKQPMGRRPAENPLSVQLNFRVDAATASALDAEVAHDSKPGLHLSRNDMARILVAEALAARAMRRSKRPK